MIEESLRKRDFEDDELRRMLDKTSVAEVINMLGSPHWVTRRHQSTDFWEPGDERPALASDDPAVMQSIGRCATSRAAGGISARFAIHDAERCQWCEYPMDEMLKACEWSQYQAAYVEVELAVWFEDQDRRRGSRYVRQVRGDYYSNVRYAEFYASLSDEREVAITRALYGQSA